MNIYFILTGFENEIPFTIKFTYTDIALNMGEHKDSEIFYCLKDYHAKEISEMPLFEKPMLVELNRDDSNSLGLLQRVSFHKFNNTKINNNE